MAARSVAAVVLLAALAVLPTACAAPAAVDEAAVMQRLRAAVVAAGGSRGHFWAGWDLGEEAPHCLWRGVDCDQRGNVVRITWQGDFAEGSAGAATAGQGAASRAAGAGPAASQRVQAGGGNATLPTMPPELAQLQVGQGACLLPAAGTPGALLVPHPPRLLGRAVLAGKQPPATLPVLAHRAPPGHALSLLRAVASRAASVRQLQPRPAAADAAVPGAARRVGLAGRLPPADHVRVACRASNKATGGCQHGRRCRSPCSLRVPLQRVLAALVPRRP